LLADVSVPLTRPPLLLAEQLDAKNSNAEEPPEGLSGSRFDLLVRARTGVESFAENGFLGNKSDQRLHFQKIGFTTRTARKQNEKSENEFNET
jgi:hypothetical protein